MRLFITILGILAAITAQSQERTIYEIQGGSASSPYVNQQVTTRGIVTAAYPTGYFIQDGDSIWSAVYVFDNQHSPVPGDSVMVYGRVAEHYQMTELKEIDGFQITSSNNPIPEPILIGTGDASEQWESVFVYVEEALCTNTDLGYNQWEINDGSGELMVSNLGVTYAPTLGVKYSIRGPLNFSYDDFKIEPRTTDDIQIDEPVFFTEAPSVTTVEETSISLVWGTNTEASTEVAYGLTPDLEAGVITISELNVNHTITLESLEANAFYYVKPFSVFETDTTIGTQFMIATASTSTGEMHCYFNHSVNTDVAWQESSQATGMSDFTDTIISYINKSETTLDITMYDIIDTSGNDVPRIMAAINEAYDRGVSVRYITDDTPENPLLEDLYEEINILRGNSEAIMHDKFMIIDANSIENSWVLTGSTNHTTANLSKDYNNIICIQDHQLAKAYELEFNEMWGSSDLSPNPAEALFGADKTNNTPHVFSINGIRVESYFSPSDNTTRQISQVIDNATETLHFGVLVFTADALGTAVLNAHNRGLTINGIVDYVDYTGDEFHMLLNEGVDVVNYINEDGSEWPIGATFHHKYAIIDQASDEAVLITGSHNWSASAESRNDENTLIIYDRRMANMYYQEFAQRFAEQKALLGINENEIASAFSIYPNPSANTFRVDMKDAMQNYQYRIIDLQGKVAQEGNLISGSAVTHNLAQGVYFVQIKSDKGTRIAKLMVK